MKQYRPNVERQKMLYSMEKSRKVLRRWQGKPEGPDPDKPRIPDNSEPWLPGGVRSVADALWISDRIKETAEQWGLNKPQACMDQAEAFPDIEADYLARLPQASRDEAVKMLERFLTPRVAESALAHSDQVVRDLGMRFLRELVQEGDPFAAEILRKIGE